MRHYGCSVLIARVLEIPNHAADAGATPGSVCVRLTTTVPNNWQCTLSIDCKGYCCDVFIQFKTECKKKNSGINYNLS